MDPDSRTEPIGLFHATPVPLALSFATKVDTSSPVHAGITYTPPLGSTAIVCTANPGLFCHRMVFPSADSFVTELGGIGEELRTADKM
jgi:hypothetical protein